MNGWKKVTEEAKVRRRRKRRRRRRKRLSPDALNSSGP
jgi:hypothetical protein